MTRRTVAGREVEVTAEGVVAAMDGVLPEPLKIHYVVVAGRRYPPKQVLEAVTGIDRSDFTTHHARRILQRAGLGVGRLDTRPAEYPSQGDRFPRTHEADALRPFMGRWVAQCDDRVLVDAATPQEVVAWLHARGERGTVLYVPRSLEETESFWWR